MRKSDNDLEVARHSVGVRARPHLADEFSEGVGDLSPHPQRVLRVQLLLPLSAQHVVGQPRHVAHALKTHSDKRSSCTEHTYNYTEAALQTHTSNMTTHRSTIVTQQHEISLNQQNTQTDLQ